MLVSRVVLLSVLATTTNGFGLNCNEHVSCRTRICEVFDDVCEEDHVCEQLFEPPRYQCHAVDEVQECQESALCRSEICDIFGEDMCGECAVCDVRHFLCHFPTTSATNQSLRMMLKPANQEVAAKAPNAMIWVMVI